MRVSYLSLAFAVIFALAIMDAPAVKAKPMLGVMLGTDPLTALTSGASDIVQEIRTAMGQIISPPQVPEATQTPVKQ
ncbi:uncharacterized protein LOC120358518 [Solenopsis invicta]|uniref:uncharacterized protein LOC120358518 n=1 Tax=Solenopsis invicta TaxID=13686 RepID=UPI00193DEAD2|nr:uncharacterized protein LOC120358518 [Solenopsis invicta]